LLTDLSLITNAQKPPAPGTLASSTAATETKGAIILAQTRGPVIGALSGYKHKYETLCGVYSRNACYLFDFCLKLFALNRVAIELIYCP